MNPAVAGAASAAAGAILQQPDRAGMLARLASTPVWDVAVIGGGATGLGVALDAAARGFSVVLLEAEDFAKGTSSRATKLVHGGVRYLAQGNLGLVREALAERRNLLDNASHLAQPLQFVMPVYGRRGRWFDKWFYGAGLVTYDLLAGRAGLGRTRFLGRDAAIAEVPGVRAQGLAGAVAYWDGIFDDARLALTLARTAIAQGACILNHCRVETLSRSGGRIDGLEFLDAGTGIRHRLRARCVINATGVWVDEVRRMDRPSGRDIVAPSQGVHLVVDRSFQPSDRAILVPATADGRVLFVVPWMGRTILGTTDTPREDLAIEPLPFEEEIDFILAESARYLARPPRRSDILSMWVGLRPLVRPADGDTGNTKRVSREHTVLVADSGLVTVTGGKWTTYRAMAEDVLEQCFEAKLLPAKPAGATTHLRLAGAPQPQANTIPVTAMPGAHLYGLEAAMLARLPGAQRELAPGLTEAMVRFAARHEYALSVEDVLARRSRLLFIDARAAAAIADAVGAILREELGEAFDADASAAAFRELAAQYLPSRPALDQRCGGAPMSSSAPLAGPPGRAR
jgi:glycerol-3-phosphate dehydrogenase